MSKMNLKRTISIMLLGTMVLTAMPVTSMAQDLNGENNIQQNKIIQPRWQYIDSTANAFSINNGVAEIDCWVEGDVFDATKAKVIAELQVKSESDWIPVKIWTDTQNSHRASVYKHYNVDAGKTYRVKATFIVWEGSQSEQQIVISNEKP